MIALVVALGLFAVTLILSLRIGQLECRVRELEESQRRPLPAPEPPGSIRYSRQGKHGLLDVDIPWRRL